MHYYQHHIGDFIRDTSRLPDSHCMAYLRMIWLYYESESPLQNNVSIIALKVGADVDIVNAILQAFFNLDGDSWRHKRCDSEIAEYHSIRDRNRENGKLGGRPRKTQSVSSGMPVGTQPEPSGNPNITLTSNHKPETSNQSIDTPRAASKKGTRLPDDWVLPKAWGEWALVERKDLSVEDVRRAGDSFADYWHAKSGREACKLDWEATWRNWIRNQRQGSAQTQQVRASIFAGVT